MTDTEKIKIKPAKELGTHNKKIYSEWVNRPVVIDGCTNVHIKYTKNKICDIVSVVIVSTIAGTAILLKNGSNQ